MYTLFYKEPSSGPSSKSSLFSDLFLRLPALPTVEVASNLAIIIVKAVEASIEKVFDDMNMILAFSPKKNVKTVPQAPVFWYKPTWLVALGVGYSRS